MVRRSQVTGCGSYLPARVMTNAQLAKTVDTSDDWIRQRTGIRERRVAEDGERTSDLGLKAAREALDMARLEAGDLDLIVCATSTPDETFPATATRRSRIPVRWRIHSSEVSTDFASWALVITRAGRYDPQPVTCERRTITRPPPARRGSAE